MNYRLTKKYFKCHKCKDVESQLIHPNQFQIKCSNCGAFLEEIPENEYKILFKTSKTNKNEELKMNNDMPYMPSEDAFRNISSVYERPPSNGGNYNLNQNGGNRNRFMNPNQNNRRRRNNRKRRYQSTNHYSDMNIVNDYNYNNNSNDISNNISNNNINDDFSNNIQIDNNNNINSIINENNNEDQFRDIREQRPNRNNEESEENNETEERERYYQRQPHFWGGDPRRHRRGRSSNPMNISFSDNFFNNFFNAPLFPLGVMMPPMIFSNNDGNFHIFVQNQNVPQFIFDPMFLAFGSMFDDSFRNNFSSNFRSNFRGNFLNEIIRILERNQEEAARRAHPPTSDKVLKKLKKFPLTEKYCKKDKNGKDELPSCCICLSDIEKNEETVLLPCGHMFHWNCCLTWLKNNNTCPMCRFELKDQD